MTLFQINFKINGPNLPKILCLTAGKLKIRRFKLNITNLSEIPGDVKLNGAIM